MIPASRKSLLVIVATCLAVVAACESKTPPPAKTEAARAERPQDILAHSLAQDAVVRGLSNAVGQAVRHGEQLFEREPSEPPKDLVEVASVLSLYFAANTHGEVDDCGCKANPLGGIARRATLVSDTGEKPVWWKARNWKPTASLNVDAGDLLFKTATLDRSAEFEQRLGRYEAETIIDALNLSPPDAVLAGELDFAMGLEAFEGFVGRSKFGWISANLYKGQERLLPSHVVVEKGGKKIVVVGVTRQITSRDGFWKERGLNVEDPATSIASVMSEVGKVDAVILLSNLGARDTEALIEGLKASDRPDVVVVSNSNSLTREPLWVEGVPILEPLSQGKMIGRADMLIRGEGRPVWMNERPDLRKVAQAYRRAWATYASARQRRGDVMRDRAESILKLAKMPAEQKVERERIEHNAEFLEKEIVRVESRLALISADLLKSGQVLSQAIDARKQPVSGDDWLDLQIAEVKLTIVGPPDIERVVAKRAKKRPANSSDKVEAP